MQPKFHEAGARFASVLLLSTAGTLVVPMSANAAPITTTFEGTAGGFVDGTLISPFSSIEFAFTVTYDPLVSTGFVAAPVDAYTGTLSLPDFGPWVYQYNAGTQEMVIGDRCLSISATECSFTVSASDAIFSLTLTDPDNPVFSGMTLRVNGTRPSGGTELGTFSATVRTINSTTSTTVPEPGTLALLGLGIVGLGLSRRRKAD